MVPGDRSRTLNRSAGPESDVRNDTATASVTREGVVRPLVVESNQESATQNHRVSIRIDDSTVGETAVDRPTWTTPPNATGTPVDESSPTGATGFG